MKHVTQLRLIIFSMLGLLFMSILWMPMPTVQAQGVPKPTPTNISSGGGERDDSRDDDDDDDDRGLDLTISADVQGLSDGANITGQVIDYTTGQPQSGISVTLTGNGIKAETVTDITGAYRFAGLGVGRAVLNITPPPGATAVTTDWPVVIHGQETVNLGYYSGRVNPLPVRLSSRLQGHQLWVTVENRSPNQATNGTIEVQLPLNLQASTNITMSTGQLRYSPNRPTLQIAAIKPGQRVDLAIPLQKAATIRPYRANYAPLRTQRRVRVAYVNQPDETAPNGAIQVGFTYAQQRGPQSIAVSSEVNLAQAEAAAETTSACACCRPCTPSNLTVAEATATPETATEIAAVKPELKTEVAAVESKLETETVATKTDVEGVVSKDVSTVALVPDAGGVVHPRGNLAQLGLALLLCSGLLFSGLWALREE